MKLIKRVLLSVFIFFVLSANSNALTRLFYLQRTDMPHVIHNGIAGFTSLKAHQKSIDILVTQAYQVDENGIVWGYVDPEVYSLTKINSIKLMPLFTNAKFDKEKTHLFLQNEAAQTRAIQSLLTACKQFHYYGLQLDFENISMNDRDALTHFYTLTAKALHGASFAVSIALPPILPEDPNPTFIQKKFYENWEAAYDFKKLGEITDFVTIMAYNQHAGNTTPGPSADIHWVENTLQYALKYIPANKISLGIPAWSNYWFTDKVEDGAKITSQHLGMNYPDLIYLLNKFHLTLQWDEDNKISYKMFTHNWLNQYVFVEDVNSFKAKLALAEKYHINGISVFALGMEDPRIWTELTK